MESLSSQHRPNTKNSYNLSPPGLSLGLPRAGVIGQMFRKILIANRGEIAVRIIRACREMGVSPVAVFSEADRCALHVRLADEAYCIGPPPSVESYLRGETIIEVALKSGAEAIHPGYGFLAENAAFARAVEEAGLVFIGPPWRAIARLGDKTQARQIAVRVGAPIVPGLTHAVASLDELVTAAEEVGYPILLKAAAGGGGKGMRIVERPEQLSGAFEMAQSEAEAAFGDGSIYVEKYIEHPRHIEIQILGDHHGNMIHLGERECSIQRRHQKVIEECPSPLDDPTLRQRMGEVAVRIARAAEYTNAGTVEFLVDSDRNFYFLEVNTRLQVEHPATELVTGIDLVRQQLRIAAGEPLDLTQADIEWRGAAIECRIYAEDADNDFLPCPGTILRLRTPSGPGVRDDSGIFEGWEVPIHYDPLLAKLIVWGRTRTEAIDRMRRALDEYIIDSIQTTIPFYRAVACDPSFRDGRTDTGYIERFLKAHPSESKHSAEADADLLKDAAMIAAAIHYTNQSRQSEAMNHSEATQSQWKIEGRRALLNSRL
jgi:acetyl-CoA carboxylase biotin carboxylase subunit